MSESSWAIILIVALSGIVSASAVLIFFWRREIEERRYLLRQQILQTTLPLRLQALERAALFLERNDPNNLLPRLAPHTFQRTADLIQTLFQVVQEEYLHNSAYQIYTGPHVWQALRTAKNTLLQTLQATLAEHSPQQTPPLIWVERFKEKWRAQAADPFQIALAYVHRELQKLSEVA
ncbi:MAG: hypothetical protein N2253_00020 [Bacteroidia bacterium]|nr:hypothetical protein [Bacteroidia bacterium]MCX7763268.1 hypothetical protein [Bacteroidia bacterium]MDW8057565.1 hypothetical protein [Bacteroidia bacterium]